MSTRCKTITMYDEAYFQSRVNHFYEEVDQAFRTLGCEAVGMHDIFFRLSRMATPTSSTARSSASSPT